MNLMTDWAEFEECPVARAVKYSCGHVGYKIVKLMRGNSKKETQRTEIYESTGFCPVCAARSDMQEAAREYEKAKRRYEDLQALQEDGSNYCTDPGDEMIQRILEKMLKNLEK